MASFVLIILIIATIVTGNGFSNIDDAEVDRLLKKLNKPALKSIKVDYTCEFTQISIFANR